MSLLITTDLKEEAIALEEDGEDISNVVIDTFVDEQEWDLKNFVQCEPRVGSCNLILIFVVRTAISF